MRIKAIQLSWFRGAADPVLLEPDCKSMVVYGVNGSGKSSFVDAVEYVLNGGKIQHLAHEHSGKRQEKAVPNTHKPEKRKAALAIKFKDDSELRTEIENDGTMTSSGSGAITMGTWDYRRTVLRQNEVAAFIHATKGDKYSALLPLLGLHQKEIAAENLRRLAKTVEQQAQLRETKGALQQLEAKRKETFGTDDDDQIIEMIEDLHAKYCADKVATKDALARCGELGTALSTQTERFSEDQRRYLGTKAIAELDLKGGVDAVRAASVMLAGAVEPLILEKLEVVQSTHEFVANLADEKEVKCPACGQTISVDDFQAHVRDERERLGEIMSAFNNQKAAIGTLSDTLKSLKSNMNKGDVQSWRDGIAKGPLADCFAVLDRFDAEKLRASCGEVELIKIEDKLLPLIDAAASASEAAPPDVQKLLADTQMVEAASAVIAGIDQARAARRAESLISVINSLEQGLRDTIRSQSQSVIREISADMQAMWKILHPGEAIEDLRLYLPKGADKAIDIELKFHGLKQESPRLTLSEGHRNSLGLCIFLAMAKREKDKDRPVFLDDVVVSLDRNHRGMIVELLEKEFGGRQVVILTHDREWYTELRQQLDGKSWVFKALLPYETPTLGIRWSHKTTTFDDARAQLKERPDSAGNDARKIMDVELALIAERLKIRLPYLRADKNDKRMAHDFLERFIADGKKCFQKKGDHGYEIYTDAIDAFEESDRLLVSWANRASHTFDVVRPEATRLIDACEKALEFFRCSSCGKGVWFADAQGSEWVQCQCGELRWRYGKG